MSVRDSAGSRRRERVAIGLGSNLGDREAHLRLAVRRLRPRLDRMEVSGVYATTPVHVTEQPTFLNACCIGATRLEPERLLETLQDLERRAGRRPGGERFGPRELDLDLLLYGEQVIERPGLTVPHPRMRARAFVMLPLAEIAADWVVPASEGVPARTVGELAECVSPTGVVRTAIELGGS